MLDGSLTRYGRMRLSRVQGVDQISLQTPATFARWLLAQSEQRVSEKTSYKLLIIPSRRSTHPRFLLAGSRRDDEQIPWGEQPALQ